MGKYTEQSSSSEEEEEELEEPREFEGALLVIDGVVSSKNMVYKDRDLIVKHLRYWKKRRRNIVDLRVRAKKLSEVIMSHQEKVALVKKVSEIDSYYHMREVLRIIAVQTCNPTVMNEIDYVFSAEALDNATVRQIESFVNNPTVFIDQRMFTRIVRFIKCLEEILIDFDEENRPKKILKVNSGTSKRKHSGIGKSHALPSSKVIRNGISRKDDENERKDYRLPLLLPLKPRNCEAMQARRNQKPGSVIMWLPLTKSVWSTLRKRRTGRRTSRKR